MDEEEAPGLKERGVRVGGDDFVAEAVRRIECIVVRVEGGEDESFPLAQQFEG